MKHHHRLISRLLTVCACLQMLTGCAWVHPEKAEWPDPLRYQDEIAAYEAQDRIAIPPARAIVCVGSSSMRMWQDRIERDLAPLTIVPRGFGGSNMEDLLYYLDRIVIPYRPRAVVLYEGDNDMELKHSPRQTMRTFKQIIHRLHERLPETRIYVLSVKPCESRWARWPQTQALNARLRRACKRDPLLTYVDVATPLLNQQGRPDPRYYGEDKLHLSDAGYDQWRNVLRPVLLQREARYETKTARQQAARR